MPASPVAVDEAAGTITNGNISPGRYSRSNTTLYDCFMSDLYIYTKYTGSRCENNFKLRPRLGNIAAEVGQGGLVSVRRVSDGAVVLRELSRTTARNASLDGNPRYDQTAVMFAAVSVGLGCMVALCYHSSTSYQIC